MTREAINELKKYTLGKKNTEKVEISVLQLNRVIKALEQEPCEDAINRQAVIKVLINNGVHFCDMVKITSDIKDLPSVNPQPKAGHWSRKTKVDAYDIAGVKTWGIKCQCDRCNFKHIVIEDFGYYNYCPNCGARMVEKQAESEE